MAGDKSKDRKRMVVEEVGAPEEEKPVEELKPVETEGPLEEVKEKVEELHEITEDIAASVDKSEEVQEELAEATQKVEPVLEKAHAAITPPPQPIGSSKMPNPLIILIPGVLLLGAILGGIYFYQKGTSTPSETPTPTAMVEGTPTPESTPMAKLDLAKYPVRIENGSGIPGTAASAKELLTKAGFKVSETGNADNYDYTDTIVMAKSTVPPEFINQLEATLGEKYSVGASKTLPDSSGDMVVVIVGSTKAQ